MRPFILLGLICLICPGCRDGDSFRSKTVTDKEMAMEIIELREKSAPEPGAPAPDLSLTRYDSGDSVKLSSFWKEKPTVLIFGSLSCDRTFNGAPHVRKLQARFGDQFHFVFVYIREAHPADGFYSKKDKFPRIIDPTTLEIRRNVAGRLCRKFEFDFPVLTDSMDDRAAIRYAAWPARIFVVDRKGHIVFKGDPGPWGYRVSDASNFFLLEEEMEGKTDLPDPLQSISLETWLMKQIES
ncbi:MAG: redoxin domain-containing protein [Verrucomicrobiales bacterium]|nr:redoxin domain-containing protein [Verrucomicrobiales bacterium]